MATLANTLWILGYPDQAVAMSDRGVRAARELAHPFTLAMVLSEMTGLFVKLGKYQEACEAANETVTLGSEYGFPVWAAFGSVGRGQALLGLNQPNEAIIELRNAIGSLRSLGTHLCLAGCLLWIAEAQIKLGQIEAALATLKEAGTETERASDRLYEAEVYRLTGEALAMIQSEAARERENFARAIEIARHQSAKSWELRATMSMARLLAQQGRRDEARTMLAEIYGWFTEGFDTVDLKDAKALLDELNG